MGERFAAEGPFADGFDPPHHTSGVGKIEGGSQLNIIPRHCSFEFEFRTLPGEDPLRFVREVEAFGDRGGAARPARHRARGGDRVRGGPGLSGPGPCPRHALRRCAASSPAPRHPTKVSFGTEGGCFFARGVPAVVCGPGDIKVAHKPDEWIAVEQLERCDAFLRALTQVTLT